MVVLELFFTMNNIFANRVPHGGKFFFIFRHNVPLHQFFIMMQIISDHDRFPSCKGQLLHCKIKQWPVICLKFQNAILL